MSSGTSAGGWPQPYRLENAEPYWAALQERRLTVQRCGGCGDIVWPAHYLCPECSSDDLAWVECSGHGRVYSWSTVFRGPTPIWAEIAPYTVGFIEMDEGYYLFAQIEADPEEITVGSPVGVRYVERGEQVLPVFGLVDSEAVS